MKHTLRGLRTEYGLSQKDLADILGVSDRTLFKYEKDSTNIPDPIVKKYLQLFNVMYDDIFLGKESDIFVQRKKLVTERMKLENTQFKVVG